MSVLLQLPTPPSSRFGFLQSAEWRWLIANQQWQNLVLGNLFTSLEHTMSTIADLTATVQTLTDNVQALATTAPELEAAVTTLVATVETLKATNGLSPEDQAGLDAAVTNVTTAAADVATQTAGLSAAQTSIPPTA